MNRNLEQNSGVRNSAQQLTLKLVGAVLLVAFTSVMPQMAVAAESRSGRDCSMAIVSKNASSTINPCDANVAAVLGALGTKFERKQLGIGSTLIVAPDTDTKQAVSAFQREAQRGNAAAQVNLGVMYANGWAVPQDYGTAIYWFKRAAEQKNGRAYYNLGALYMNGTGVQPDYEKAAMYFRLGAEEGDSGAQTNLGYLYEKGFGVSPDASKAAEYYAKAAEQGDPMAQNNLAGMLAQGIGGRKDYGAAFRLYEQAAEQGHTGARIQLAYMYSQGKGARKDLESAYMWGTAAELSGDNRGRELLTMLRGQLTAEQVQRASERARELQPRSSVLNASARRY